MKLVPLWTVLAMTWVVLSTPARAQWEEDFLFPVTFDVYLDEGHPLYKFAPGHPCGKVITLRANALPVDIPMVRLVWAYEVTREGRVEARWALPVDATPIAVNRDTLTIRQFGEDEIVFVTTAFGIGKRIDGPDQALLINDVSRAACPDAEPIRHYICSELIDARSGQRRIIAYPPVCT